MIWNSRAPKEYKFKTRKMNNHKTKSRDFFDYMQKNKGKSIVKGFEKFTHPELREFQRYATCNAGINEILKLIKNDNGIMIYQDKETQTVLVRVLNRYYVVVADLKCRFIKTFLPDTSFDLLYYVQKMLDKENLRKISFS